MSEQVGYSPRDAITEIDFPAEFGLKKIASGKVRDIFEIDESRLLIVTTDRLSAFDRVLTSIPGRGAVLNTLAAWWFNQTKDIIPNHLIDVPDPNVSVVRKYPIVPIEMVVRGFFTGSTDTSIRVRYRERGERTFGGITLPEDMVDNQSLPFPIVDPTTKATSGHDQKLTEEEILLNQPVRPIEWQALKATALSLFARGQVISARAGLLLVDTKYELGKNPETGSIVLTDEVHTPDSSRYWGIETYAERMQSGESPDIYDKEFARLWYVAQGFRGEGIIPEMPDSMKRDVLNRYLIPMQRLTGAEIRLDQNPVERIINNVGNWLSGNR